MNFDGYGQVSIEAVVRALGVPHVAVIHPFKIKKSIAAIREALDFQGTSVVIAREACPLFNKALKKTAARPFYVSSEKCKNRRDCMDELACPAFFIQEGRVKIDPDMCVGCAVCAQICPENAILPLKKGSVKL
jgi:indolepyruvate ferredoxin oxidoreductase alpha subunit